MEVLGYLSGFKQSAISSLAGTANDVVSGTKAVSTAGSDELLTSMKVRKDSFGRNDIIWFLESGLVSSWGSR